MIAVILYRIHHTYSNPPHDRSPGRCQHPPHSHTRGQHPRNSSYTEGILQPYHNASDHPPRYPSIHTCMTHNAANPRVLLVDCRPPLAAPDAAPDAAPGAASGAVPSTGPSAASSAASSASSAAPNAAPL